MPIPRRLEPEVMDSQQDAEDYDRMDHSAVNRLFVDDLLVAMRESGVGGRGSGVDILDLGTGTAQIPIELCRRFEDCRVMSVDAATSMLDLARYNLESAGMTRRIQ